MGNAQRILIFSFFTASLAQAETSHWRIGIERAGFFGTYSLGVSYEWTDRHATDLSVGYYPNNSVNFYQINISYRYSRWNVPLQNHVWRPLQIGLFTVRSLDRENYFAKSPSEYPSSGYYDQTAFRAGLLLGSALEFKSTNLAVAYYIKILDNGLIALYNNANVDLQYYVSSGLGLQYIF